MTIEWSRPRQTSMAGRRKATSTYCEKCGFWHQTRRAVGGQVICDNDKEQIQLDLFGPTTTTEPK